jgi:hypothetical protein
VLPHLGADFAEGHGFAQGGGGDADDLGTRFAQRDDLLDARFDVEGLLGDHRLDGHRVSAADHDRAHSNGAGLSPWVGGIKVH